MSPAAVRRAAAAGAGHPLRFAVDDRTLPAADRRLPRGRRTGRRAHGAPRLGRPAAARAGSSSRSTSTARYAAASAQSHWADDAVLSSADPVELAEMLVETVVLAGCDGLNIRLHVPGITPEEIRDQLAALGEVVPKVSALLGGKARSAVDGEADRDVHHHAGQDRHRGEKPRDSRRFGATGRDAWWRRPPHRGCRSPRRRRPARASRPHRHAAARAGRRLRSSRRAGTAGSPPSAEPSATACAA